MYTRHMSPMQVNLPLFVRIPFRAGGQNWKKNEEFPWLTRNFDQSVVEKLYIQGFLIHDENKETESQVGDRLAEMNHAQLVDVRERVNQVVKSRTTNTEEFRKKKLKGSKSDNKQRGLIRRFLYLNPWIVEDETLKKEGRDFYSIRDKVLGE